ncbi:MAG: hypothetical protein DDT36_01271 [Firmicutes bacterium]|nr:hypothetical protein [Bacillota bacterium]
MINIKISNFRRITSMVDVNMYENDELLALDRALYESPASTWKALGDYYSATAAWFAKEYVRKVEADGG